jgi:hypothetical protein
MATQTCFAKHPLADHAAPCYGPLVGGPEGNRRAEGWRQSRGGTATDSDDLQVPL